MKTMKWAVVAVGLAVLGGCATAGDPGMNAGLTAGLTTFADPIGVLTIPPSSTRRLTYAEGDGFDRALHASMKGGTTPITVVVPSAANLSLGIVSGGGAIQAGDPRLKRWLTRIAESGGTVHACATRPDESGLWAIAQLLAQIFTPMLTDYLTYRPAGGYDAVVFHDGQSERVAQVKFLTRAPPGADALTCEAAGRL